MPVNSDSKALGAKRELKLTIDPGVKTLFADKMQLMMRTDGLAVMRWIQDCPEFSSEAARIIVSQGHLKKIAEVLCNATGHYPTPEGSKKAK